MRSVVPALLVPALFAIVAAGACVGGDPDVDAQADAGSPVADGSSGGPGDPIDGAPRADATNEDANGGDAGDGGDGGDGAVCVPPATPRVLFLNKGGGVYTPAADDSRTNKSSIVSQSNSVPAWTVPANTWQTIVDCVKGKLSPFNVDVTDVDPGAATQHVEVVFANSAFFSLNAPSSPAVGPLTCSVVENAIGFVSQSQSETSPATGCALAAQLYGFAMGLEFTTTCPDLMSYAILGCNDAPFSKSPVTCGTTTATNCQCASGTTQTSHDRMLAVLGPRCL